MSELFQFVPINATNLWCAAEIHAISWRESHKNICSEEFVAAHTSGRQATYLQGELDKGKHLFLLIAHEPVGLVSVNGSLIENLYVHPSHWGKGYGTALLNFAEKHCKTPHLWVLSSNQRARRFYENRGYQWSGREKILSKTLRELEMVKTNLAAD